MPLRAALMPISKMPRAELNRREHNTPEPFLLTQRAPGPRRLDLLITMRPPIPGGRRPLNT
eukprot:4120811-Prymnesium_polylepis.1